MADKPRHWLMEAVAEIAQRDTLTYTDLARKLNCHNSTVTRLMSGEMQPSIRVVQSVSAAFPELRPRCAELLLIGSDIVPDQQREAVAP